MSLELIVRRPLSPVTNEDCEKCPTFAKALTDTGKHSGLIDKSLAIETDIEPAQLSRIFSGQLGIEWKKLNRLMDACGTELPLMWMLHQRGYDVTLLRQRETELQKQLRLAKEEIGKLKAERQVITDFVKEARSA